MGKLTVQSAKFIRCAALYQ